MYEILLWILLDLSQFNVVLEFKCVNPLEGSYARKYLAWVFQLTCKFYRGAIKQLEFCFENEFTILFNHSVAVLYT